MQEEFIVNDPVEIISFSKKNIKLIGKYISIDDKNNTTLELSNGTRVIFKLNDIKRVQ